MVLVKRADYIQRMKELLSDASRFKEIMVETWKEIYIFLQHKSKLINFLKQSKSGMYRWGTIFVPLLKPFTSDNYMVKNENKL